MKGNKTFEIEIQRGGVTPAQFLAYVRSRVDAKGGRMLRSDLDTRYFAAGDDLNFDIHHEGDELDGLHEKSISRPYEMQTFLRYANGATYNEICEFVYDDEKTGHGYYYLVNVEAVEDESGAETAEETTEETEAETTDSSETETAARTDSTSETTVADRAGADERGGHERRRTPERNAGSALSARPANSKYRRNAHTTTAWTAGGSSEKDGRTDASGRAGAPAQKQITGAWQRDGQN